MAIEVTTKQWGNSIGVVIPFEIVERLQIKPEERVVIEVEKKTNVLEELFGAAPFKKSARKIVDDLRKDLQSRWLT